MAYCYNTPLFTVKPLIKVTLLEVEKLFYLAGVALLGVTL